MLVNKYFRQKEDVKVKYKENCYSCLYGTLSLGITTSSEVFGTCNVCEGYVIPLDVIQFREGCNKFEKK